MGLKCSPRALSTTLTWWFFYTCSPSANLTNQYSPPRSSFPSFLAQHKFLYRSGFQAWLPVKGNCGARMSQLGPSLPHLWTEVLLCPPGLCALPAFALIKVIWQNKTHWQREPATAISLTLPCCLPALFLHPFIFVSFSTLSTCSLRALFFHCPLILTWETKWEHEGV